jgi:hypothetical protein
VTGWGTSGSATTGGFATTGCNLGPLTSLACVARLAFLPVGRLLALVFLVCGGVAGAACSLVLSDATLDADAADAVRDGAMDAADAADASADAADAADRSPVQPDDPQRRDHVRLRVSRCIRLP